MKHPKANQDIDILKQKLLPVITTFENSDTQDIATYKKALSDGDTIIHNIYTDGAAIRSIIHLRTYLVDHILLHIWQSYFSPESKTKIALIAVGGYGRGELHPFSDVDIMVLLKDAECCDLDESISAFITRLWDVGLDIGHSVRTVDECINECSDLTVITNLMESRLLEGSRVLFSIMMEAIEPEATWGSDAFFNAKVEEQENRRSKFSDTAYRLEPNIKESPGALRDIQMIGWISQRHFGTEKIYELVESGFINKEEYNSLLDGQHLLWEIRYLLHKITKRREDRLLFDYQKDLAHHLGYADESHNRAIEGFMQSYYRTVMQMQRLNDMILQKFQETLQERKQEASFSPVNERFQLRNGYLETIDPDLFKKEPASLLEVFQLYATTEHIKGLRANTIRQIRANILKLDKPFENNERAKELFIELLRNPRKLTRKLRLMNRYGVLAAYLPEFENIVGRMQYDLFHIYTVDEHSIRVIRNARRFALEQYRYELSHCSNIMDQVKKPEILYIIGLFHDIAKGRAGDHSDLGAIIVEKFCKEHGYSDEETELARWVIKNHLLMSVTAQRRDITDPDVIQDFAEQVQTRDKLNLLYLHTVADIRATNPDLWNSWKDSLLKELFKQTARALHRGLESPLQKDAAISQKKLDSTLLLDDKFDTKIVEELWEKLGDEYFLRYFPDEISWHTKEILTLNEKTPLVKFRRKTERGSTEILVYTLDHDNLFDLIVTELGRLGLDILAANIGTTMGDYALNTFLVLEQDAHTISSTERIKQVRKSLLECLKNPNKLSQIKDQKTPRRLRNFSMKPRVSIDNDISEYFTSVYIETIDRPGVLSRIARCFLKHDIQIHNAKISTMGEKVEDVFFVTTKEARKFHNEELIQAFNKCITTELSD